MKRKIKLFITILILICGSCLCYGEMTYKTGGVNYSIQKLVGVDANISAEQLQSNVSFWPINKNERLAPSGESFSPTAWAAKLKDSKGNDIAAVMFWYKRTNANWLVNINQTDFSPDYTNNSAECAFNWKNYSDSKSPLEIKSVKTHNPSSEFNGINNFQLTIGYKNNDAIANASGGNYTINPGGVYLDVSGSLTPVESVKGFQSRNSFSAEVTNGKGEVYCDKMTYKNLTAAENVHKKDIGAIKLNIQGDSDYKLDVLLGSPIASYWQTGMNIGGNSWAYAYKITDKNTTLIVGYLVFYNGQNIDSTVSKGYDFQQIFNKNSNDERTVNIRYNYKNYYKLSISNSDEYLAGYAVYDVKITDPTPMNILSIDFKNMVFNNNNFNIKALNQDIPSSQNFKLPKEGSEWIFGGNLIDSNGSNVGKVVIASSQSKLKATSIKFDEYQTFVYMFKTIVAGFTAEEGYGLDISLDGYRNINPAVCVNLVKEPANTIPSTGINIKIINIKDNTTIASHFYEYADPSKFTPMPISFLPDSNYTYSVIACIAGDPAIADDPDKKIADIFIAFSDSTHFGFENSETRNVHGQKIFFGWKKVESDIPVVLNYDVFLNYDEIDKSGTLQFSLLINKLVK